jgi:hypothetical protein
VARERYVIDGYDVTEGNVRDVETREGLATEPDLRGDDQEIANSIGDVFVPKVYGPGRFTMQVWWGVSTTRAAVEAAFEELQRVVSRPHRMCRIVRTLSDGSTRQCDAYKVSSMKPTAIGQRGYRAGIEFKIPRGFWRGTADVVDETPAGAALPKTLALVNVGAGTAPVDDSVYRVIGPISDPVVVDTTDGVDKAWFSYAGQVPANAHMEVNAATWTVVGVGFTVNQQAVAFSERMTTVAGPPGQNPTVALRGTNGGATTALRVTGRPAWLSAT